jgi:23S rRNA pseudouridine1911/1915/1917 synthase
MSRPFLSFCVTNRVLVFFLFVTLASQYIEMAQNQKNRGSKRENKPTSTRFNVKTNSTIMEFLQSQMQGKSRTSLKQLLSGGFIKLNDRTVTNFSQPVKPGDVVLMEKSKKRVIKLPAAMKIVFEDDHLIVVNKDAGLLSISTSKENRQTAFAHLSEYVKQHDENNKVFIVHRLDRETSGLMVFAKSMKAKEMMQAKWKDTVLCRRYYALVEGYVEKESGTINTWLSEHPKSLKVYVSQPGTGVEAVTHYRVMDGSRFYTLLDIELETGRKNQIRVHMKHIGHPVTGDTKYGAHNNAMKRLGLHAAELTFIHPFTNKTMSFKTAVPPVFYKTMEEE